MKAASGSSPVRAFLTHTLSLKTATRHMCERLKQYQIEKLIRHIHISILSSQSLCAAALIPSQTCDIITAMAGSATGQPWALGGYIEPPVKSAMTRVLGSSTPHLLRLHFPLPVLADRSPPWPALRLTYFPMSPVKAWCQPTACCLSALLPFLFAVCSGPDPSCHSLTGRPPSTEP